MRQIVTDAPKRHKPRDARPTGTISAAAPPRRQSVASSCGSRGSIARSVENIPYHLYVLQAVERGKADVAAGRIIPHEEVETALRRKWLRAGEG